MKKPRWNKKQKVAGILTLMILLGIVGIIIADQHGKKTEESVVYKDTAVKVGTISQTLSTTGEIKSEKSEKLVFDKSKTFRAMCVEAKEYVPAGEPIAVYADGSVMKEERGGVISKINAPRTGQKGDGSQCVIFLPTDKVHLEITVPENDINRIPFDGTAEVAFHGQKTKNYSGKVTYIGAESNNSQDNAERKSGNDVEESSEDVRQDTDVVSENSSLSNVDDNGNTGAVYTITITLDNDGTLLPGMSADCTLLLEKKENILVIPVEGVFFDDGGRYVNVVTKSGDIQRVSVETGISDAHNVEIISGLDGSETIRYQISNTEENVK